MTYLPAVFAIALLALVLCGEMDIYYHLRDGFRLVEGWNMEVFEAGLEWVERIAKEVKG